MSKFDPYDILIKAFHGLYEKELWNVPVKASKVSDKEFLEIVKSDRPQDYAIIACVNSNSVYIWNGVFRCYIIYFKWFDPDGIYDINPKYLDIVDFGQGIVLGEDYEVGFDTILYDFDSGFRKWRDSNLVKDKDNE